MTKNECIKMFLPLFATAIMACGGEESTQGQATAEETTTNEEVVREDCKNGQAIHEYNLSAEAVARTMRALVHVVIGKREIIYYGVPNVEDSIDLQATGPESTAYVSCVNGEAGSYVEFVRDL